MGTRSSIGIENADGTVLGIYCHWDGYPSHNGRILQDHYADEATVRELVALGDISSLKEEIGERHPFDTYHLKEDEKDPRWDGWTTAYGRDRGEKDCEVKTFASAKEYYTNFPMGGVEYAYLYRSGEWYMSPTYRGMGWLPLKTVLEASEEEA